MKNTLIMIVAVVLAGVAGFYGGSKYQQSQMKAGFSGRSRGMMTGSQQLPSSGSSFRPVSGEIIDKDSQSLTVKLVDGGSKIILLSQTTKINRTETGTVADLEIGEPIAIFGTENSDGSVTAENIQLNAQMRQNFK